MDVHVLLEGNTSDENNELVKFPYEVGLTDAEFLDNGWVSGFVESAIVPEACQDEWREEVGTTVAIPPHRVLHVRYDSNLPDDELRG